MNKVDETFTVTGPFDIETTYHTRVVELAMEGGGEKRYTIQYADGTYFEQKWVDCGCGKLACKQYKTWKRRGMAQKALDFLKNGRQVDRVRAGRKSKSQK